MHFVNSPLQIGANLRARRGALKVSQATMAARLGISQQRLSDLETEPGSLTVERLLVWLNLLNLELFIADRSAKRTSKSEW
jgi:HTH-type transcriptional regulator / antitoxin HipB